MKKQTTIKIMVFVFMSVQFICGTAQGATNSWNVGSGTWDASATSWLSPMTWTDGDTALFTNRADAVTVTVSGGRAADLVRVGTSLTNTAYTFVGGAGSIAANNFVVQFQTDVGNPKTILTNLAMTLSGKLAAGRGWLVLAGNTAVSADRFISASDGGFGGDGTWGNLWLKDTATLRVTNGIVSSYNGTLLDGGTLSTSYITMPDWGPGTFGNCTLNGGRIVALPGAQNINFFQNAAGNPTAMPYGPYVSTLGVVFDTDTNNIIIKLPFKHNTSGAATDGGLVKLGTGTLIFSGVTNTYNGMTVVSNGTLVVSNMSALSAGHVTVVNTATVSLNSARSGGSISDSKNVYVNGSGTVLIASNINEAVYEFYIDGALQNPGVWGRVGGGAANESPRISGDGTLAVNHNPTPFVWNVTNGVWDAVTTNWLAGGIPAVWGGGLPDAIFTNGASVSGAGVSITSTMSAGAVRIGNNSNNCAYYSFSSTTGSSLSASSVLLQGRSNNGQYAGPTTFTNLNLNVSGDVGVGRWTLLICGNSVLNLNRLVSSELMGATGNDNQWAGITIRDNASVTTSSGIILNSLNNLTLHGGSLSAPAIKIADYHIDSRTRFNGGRLVALVSTNDFIQMSGSVSASFLPYGVYVSTNGAYIDTYTNTVTISVPFKHDGTNSYIDGGLIKLGSGILTLNTTNYYSGTTTVSNGTLRLPAFNNGVSSSGSVTVASGATLDLVGYSQMVSNLTGSGTITNLASGKTLTVTGTDSFSGTMLGGGTTVVSGVISPAGPAVIGQINMANALVLSGALQVDVATDGSSDLLVTQGALDLAGATLSVVNTNDLNADKRYVVLSYSNAPAGAFSDSQLPPHWITQNDTANKRILLRRESSGSLLMIQ